MDPAKLTNLESLISPARYNTYRRYYEGADRFASRLYFWNIEIGQAMWGPISILEVVLRNTMHSEMANRGNKVDDWWNDPSIHLCPRERQKIDRAIRTLQERGNSNPSAHDVVAATSLGLWVGLLDKGYPRSSEDYDRYLWTPRLRHAFPHMRDPAKPQANPKRKEVHTPLAAIMELRNRIAHHEPVFNSPFEDLLDDIITVLRYIDPDVASFVRDTNRVADVLARRQEAVSKGACLI